MSVLPEERILTTLHTVALAVQGLQRMGVDAERVLEGSGIPVADLASPTRLVSHAQELRVLANALAASADPALGLLLGKRMHVSAYGMLGYTLLASRNLGEALRLAIAHPALLGTYFRLELQAVGDEVRLSASGYRYDPALRQFNIELCLTSLLTVVQDLLGESVRPRRLLLEYPAPAHAASYSERLGCPVEFDAGCNALCFNPKLLERTLPLADPVSHQHGLQQCMQLEAQLHSRHDLRDLIRQQLSGDLSECSTLERVATRLHRSERTLRRHLQQLNTSFQHLLDEVRYDKARQLLLNTDKPIYLIAEELGYSETASFRHAFQRWSGLAPSELRR
ncbi:MULTISPECIES: AraC family transcriptional regulator [unclassified Pseudomonas]|uniref:AraC family transcriptional regulator n=1 Tax=unclassified Pseudomonas TaxID=196821 RepID=UPI00244D5525|nr:MULTISPECIES: AraC family transcriptional regulator [unclassified Pseudomonas]MDG9923269.1 AraC family transcriptional regulator [Pseudomonas sp. GD04045]MDH0034654.1 AraC family transcriptional regulator [Pseudomonas sp. GD04019]